MKIKDLGFHGECGYNQLLYPVEHQTRDLLKWIIDKVPRTQEEGGAEEILGANAILNRNIMKSLQSWQKSLWRLPVCEEGKPPVSIYKKISFTSTASGSFSAARLLHKHSLDKIRDAQITERMNRKFKGSNSKGGNAGDANDDGFGAENAKVLQQKILASLKEKTEKKNQASSSSAAGGGGIDGSGDSAFGDDDSNLSAAARAEAQMNMSFQELVAGIASSAGGDNGENKDDHRGGRFSHATVFSQEESAVVTNSSSGVSVSNAVIAAASATGFNAAGLNAEHAAKLASITKDGIEAAQKFAKMDLQERKAQMELEEQDRQQQLQTTKTEIEDLGEVGKSYFNIIRFIWSGFDRCNV